MSDIPEALVEKGRAALREVQESWGEYVPSSETRMRVRAVLAAVWPDLPAARPVVDAPCPTCSGPSRETVGMVCQTCGRDYGSPSTIPDAWRDRRDGRIYVNRRKHAGLPFVFDADSDAEPFWLVPSAPPDADAADVRRAVAEEALLRAADEFPSTYSVEARFGRDWLRDNAARIAREAGSA